MEIFCLRAYWHGQHLFIFVLLFVEYRLCEAACECPAATCTSIQHITLLVILWKLCPLALKICLLVAVSFSLGTVLMCFMELIVFIHHILTDFLLFAIFCNSEVQLTKRKGKITSLTKMRSSWHVTLVTCLAVWVRLIQVLCLLCSVTNVCGILQIVLEYAAVLDGCMYVL